MQEVRSSGVIFYFPWEIKVFHAVFAGGRPFYDGIHWYFHAGLVNGVKYRRGVTYVPTLMVVGVIENR